MSLVASWVRIPHPPFMDLWSILKEDDTEDAESFFKDETGWDITDEIFKRVIVKDTVNHCVDDFDDLVNLFRENDIIEDILKMLCEDGWVDDAWFHEDVQDKPDSSCFRLDDWILYHILYCKDYYK